MFIRSARQACRIHKDSRAGDGPEGQHHMQCHLPRVCADRFDTQPAGRHSEGQRHLKGMPCKLFTVDAAEVQSSY